MFINKFLNLSIFDGSEDSLEDPSFTDHNHGEFRGGETNEMKVELQQAPKSRPGGPQSADLWSGPALEGQTGAALREEPSPLLGEICQRPGVMDEMKSMMEKQVRDRESESDLITLKSDIMTLLEKCKRFTDTIWDSDEQKCQKNKVMTLELEKENKEISKELATLKDKLFNMLSLKDKFLKLTKQREFVQGQKAWLGSQISNLKLKIQNEEALLMSTLGLSAKELEEKYKEEFSQIKLLQGQRAQLHTEFNHLRSKSSVASSLRGRVSNLKDEKRDGKSQQINKKTAICTQQRRKAAATCPKQADVLKCDGNSQRKKQDTILREKEEVLKSPKDNETISSLKDVKNETTVLKWETITSSTSICKPKHIQTQLEAVGSDAIAMMKKEESLTGEIPASQEQQLLQSTPQCAAAEKTGLESEPLSKIEELKLQQSKLPRPSAGQPGLKPKPLFKIEELKLRQSKLPRPSAGQPGLKPKPLSKIEELKLQQKTRQDVGQTWRASAESRIQELKLFQNKLPCASAGQPGFKPRHGSKIEELKLRQSKLLCASAGQPDLKPKPLSKIEELKLRQKTRQDVGQTCWRASAESRIQELKLFQRKFPCASAGRLGLKLEPLSKIEELKLRQRMRQCVSVGQPSLEPIAES